MGLGRQSSALSEGDGIEIFGPIRSAHRDPQSKDATEQSPLSFLVPMLVRRNTASHMTRATSNAHIGDTSIGKSFRIARRHSTGALPVRSSFGPFTHSEVDFSEGDLIEAFPDLNRAASSQNPLQREAECDRSSSSDSIVDDNSMPGSTVWPADYANIYEVSDCPPQAPTRFIEEIVKDLNQNERWMKADEELVKEAHSNMRFMISEVKARGMEPPYRNSEEVIPSFSALHTCVGKNLRRNHDVAPQKRTTDTCNTVDVPASRWTLSSSASATTAASCQDYRDDLVVSSGDAEKNVCPIAEVDSCSSYIVSFEYLRMRKKFEKDEPKPDSQSRSELKSMEDSRRNYDLVENDERSVLANYLYCREPGTETHVTPTSLCSVSGIRCDGTDTDTASTMSENIDNDISFAQGSISSSGFIKSPSQQSLSMSTANENIDSDLSFCQRSLSSSRLTTSPSQRSLFENTVNENIGGDLSFAQRSLSSLGLMKSPSQPFLSSLGSMKSPFSQRHPRRGSTGGLSLGNRFVPSDRLHSITKAPPKSEHGASEKIDGALSFTQRSLSSSGLMKSPSQPSLSSLGLMKSHYSQKQPRRGSTGGLSLGNRFVPSDRLHSVTKAPPKSKHGARQGISSARRRSTMVF